ncbi:hypothetical protein ACRAWB_14685 [Leifsonia poae]|uniref:hypothetical protein n=1 Tax=Leifsonia poae TaxID=110933 RepID=UPI003D6930CE
MDDRKRNITVLFVSSSRLSAQEAGQLLAEHFAGVSYPDEIWILGIADNRTTVADLARHQDLKDRVPGFTRFRDTPVLLPFVVNMDGGIESVDGQALAPPVVAAVFSYGLVSIFRAHNGMLDAHAGYHYVKPSKRHSDHFLRTANVLLYGAEVEFIAAAILRRVAGRQVHRIYTDSSSINSLGLSLADLLSRLRGDVRPSVDSFSSYQGLKSDFIIEPDEKSFALISASTSGGLVDELESTRQISRDQQLIVFYVGPPLSEQLVLQDLTSGANELGYIDPFQSWEPKECPLCDQNQSTVIIQGDQFLPASPTVTGRMIGTKDAPSWLNPFMRDVAGKGIITCRLGNRTFYLQIGKVLSGDAGMFSERISAAIERYIPAATEWIVPLDDRDSQLLAEGIQSHLANLGVKIESDHVISARALTEGSHQPLAGGVVVVVASVVVSGRALLNVSRALRTLHPDQPISYFVTLMRTPGEAEARDLEVNLAWGPRGAQFDVHTVTKVFVPNEREVEASTWDRERKFLTVVAERIQKMDQSARIADQLAAIKKRIEELRGPSVGQLFLPGIDADGNEFDLELRPNFAFWSFQPTPKASQADVFFTMTSVLHALRNSRRSASLTRDHNWNVLDPRNFSRFNDGVIQASLLRAALPYELDYSTDAAMSHQMQAIVDASLNSADPAESSAMSEFLLALCTGTLRLEDPDLQLMAHSLKHIAAGSDLRAALAEYFRVVVVDIPAEQQT